MTEHPDVAPGDASDLAPPDAVDALADLVRRADGHDRAAADALFTALYHELHRVAERSLRHAAGPARAAVGATSLLHEAWLNVACRDGVAFVDRGRFLAYAARAMRGLLVDHARRGGALKRGAGAEITLADDEPPDDDALRRADDLTRLGDALDELATVDAALAELVELHFFCGFTFAEVAGLRGVSERTVQRDWRKARLLLQAGMGGGE